MYKLPSLIGVAGRMYSGKSTTALVIKDFLWDDGYELDVRVYSFATTLKEFLVNNNWLTWDDFKNKNGKTRFQWKNMPGTTCFLEEYLSVRELMQYIGTDVFRAIDNDIWINLALKQVEKDYLEEGFDVAVFDDVRFPNEFNKLKENGATMIFLNRKLNDDTHISEQLNTFMPFDIVIENNGFSEQQLKEKIKHVLGKIQIQV